MPEVIMPVWRRNMNYKVEIFDEAENDWIVRSWHKNKDHAEIQVEVALLRHPAARIIYEGKIISERRKE